MPEPQTEAQAHHERRQPHEEAQLEALEPPERAQLEAQPRPEEQVQHEAVQHEAEVLREPQAQLVAGANQHADPSADSDAPQTPSLEPPHAALGNVIRNSRAAAQARRR